MGQEFARKFSAAPQGGMAEAEGLIAAHQRNLEAITAANKVALEGAQAVARRHLEILQQTSAELAETIQALSGLEAPQAKAAKQADLVKQAYEKAIANVRELRDLVANANGEAVELLNRRFLESLDEIKQLVDKHK